MFWTEPEDNLQEMLHGLHEWTNKWRMSVNITKYKIIHFRKKCKQQTNFEFKYGDGKMDVQYLHIINN